MWCDEWDDLNRLTPGYSKENQHSLTKQTNLSLQLTNKTLLSHIQQIYSKQFWKLIGENMKYLCKWNWIEVLNNVYKSRLLQVLKTVFLRETAKTESDHLSEFIHVTPLTLSHIYTLSDNSADDFKKHCNKRRNHKTSNFSFCHNVFNCIK